MSISLENGVITITETCVVGYELDPIRTLRETSFDFLPVTPVSGVGA
jgi:hypothetical protein